MVVSVCEPLPRAVNAVLKLTELPLTQRLMGSLDGSSH